MKKSKPSKPKAKNVKKPVASGTKVAFKAKGKPFDVIRKEAGDKKIVLHIGCGTANKAKLHKNFHGDQWHELRLDIDENVAPDIVADMRDLSIIPDNSVDAVWSSHNIEHLYPHNVAGVFKDLFRLIKPNGLFLVTMPDIQSVANFVAHGNLEEPIYDSPAGPIAPIDILYGFRASMERGNLFMAHKTGFTAETLAKYFRDAGFCNIRIQRQWVDLWGVGHKLPIGHPNRVEKTSIEVDERTQKLQPPPAMPLNRSPHPGALGPNRLTDELDIPPKLWEPLGLKKQA
jgi:ubiquinone/menaquinone biosynthesis C-methylase UbiE